jgi:hypothetical protein
MPVRGVTDARRNGSELSPAALSRLLLHAAISPTPTVIARRLVLVD